MSNSPQAAGVVLTYPNRRHEPEHERVVHQQLARRLAALRGLVFGGDFDPQAVYPGPRYLVPSGTIVGLDLAHALGLRHEDDLFGGVVPSPFIETKAITHPLISADAHAPAGWSAEFCARVRDSVLPGFTAFSPADARQAAARLLADGPLRLKPVLATAGRGQRCIRALDELDEALAALDPADFASCGVVLEANLDEVETISVGQVRFAGRLISYHGRQRLTRDNQGEEVYGGSDLVVVQGDFAALLALDLPEPVRLAVAQAQVYDQAAAECFPAFFASRRNYDVARGRAADGQWRSGVLEQSWRIGGASSAEVAALEVFAAEPTRQVVRAASRELYGRQPRPAGASVLFEGEDAQVGLIGKYVLVQGYAGEL